MFFSHYAEQNFVLDALMKPNIILKTSKLFVKITALSFFLSSNNAYADNDSNTTIGNFGLPGIIDLPTARRLPDGELIITQQLHRSLARSGITFQALPSVGVSFRYSGHGIDGPEAYGRVNHDRSFDAHISLAREKNICQLYHLG